jgi:spermidine/putrescine transport system substrate-binding protein
VGELAVLHRPGRGHRRVRDDAQFEEETGIEVNYREVIEDNESFFGTIQPSLAAGQPAGWDMITPTDYMCQRLIRLGYLQELDWSQLPERRGRARRRLPRPRARRRTTSTSCRGSRASPASATTSSSPGARSPAWTTSGTRSSRAASACSARCGTPSTSRSCATASNPTDGNLRGRRAGGRALLEQAPLVRNYYGNEYTDGLANGDVALTMAWSGDVYQLQLDNPNLRFVIPDEGGNLWVDNMCIPNGAANPQAAHAMMNFVYQPEIMAQICAYVQFISPVPAAREILADSDDEEEQELADSELIFPSEATLDQVHGYPDLSDEAEELRWLELFQDVVQG